MDKTTDLIDLLDKCFWDENVYCVLPDLDKAQAEYVALIAERDALREALENLFKNIDWQWEGEALRTAIAAALGKVEK